MATRTAAAAIAELEATIEFGVLALQHAPGGHPLFAAIEDARDTADWMRENQNILPVITVGSNTDQTITRVIGAVYSTAATISTDPARPLPATNWPALKVPPWPWIAGGVAALVVVAVVAQRRGWL